MNTGMESRAVDHGDEAARAALVEVTYYTDPLCPWSWVLEPQCNRLRFTFGDQLAWRHVLGGMIPDWKSYHDPLNEVHNPAQMAQQCYCAQQQTGMPLDERVWRADPPASSYPACLAVKAAERQGREAGEAYLRRVREAVMLGRRNVARGEVLMDLAEELAGDRSYRFRFDQERFREDLLGPEALEALQRDLSQVKSENIVRFPTLILRAPGAPDWRWPAIGPTRSSARHFPGWSLVSPRNRPARIRAPSSPGASGPHFPSSSPLWRPTDRTSSAGLTNHPRQACWNPTPRFRSSTG